MHSLDPLALSPAPPLDQPLDVGGGGSGILATFITRHSPYYLDASEEEIKAGVLASFAQFFGPQALHPTAFIFKNW